MIGLQAIAAAFRKLFVLNGTAWSARFAAMALVLTILPRLLTSFAHIGRALRLASVWRGRGASSRQSRSFSAKQHRSIGFLQFAVAVVALLVSIAARAQDVPTCDQVVGEGAIDVLMYPLTPSPPVSQGTQTTVEFFSPGSLDVFVAYGDIYANGLVVGRGDTFDTCTDQRAYNCLFWKGQLPSGDLDVWVRGYASNNHYTGEIICYQDSNDAPYTVIPPSSTPTVHLDVQPEDGSTFGDTVTMTATFSNLNGQSVDGQSVDFYDGGTKLGSANVSGTTATYPTSALTAGSHSLKAHYNGNGSTLNANDSNVVNYSVSKATPTVDLGAQPQSPSTFGQTVTLTATFDQDSLHGQNIDGDTVDFYDGATKLNADPVKITGGQAQYLATGLAAGSHTFKAHYNGDANLNGNDSTPVNYTINKATPKVILTPQPSSPSTYGQTVTLTATFDADSLHGQDVNGDTVDFYDGQTKLNPKPVPITGGQAQYPTSTLTAGSHTLKAHYNGDANLVPQDSDPVPYSVGGKTTTTSLSITPSSTTVGTVVTLTATVTPATTGTVYFCEAAAKLCTDINRIGEAQLDNGTATLKFFPGIGSYSYTAQFAGTQESAASTSSAEPLTVTGKYATNATLGTPTGNGPYSLPVTVNGVVPWPVNLSPTGQVNIIDTSNNQQLGSAQLPTASKRELNLPTAQTLTVGKNPQAIASGSFDYYYNASLAVANADDKTVTIYPGGGNGKVWDTPRTTLQVPNAPTALTLADFNNDGNLDVAAGNGPQVSIYLGNGDDTFGSAKNTPFADTSYGTSLAMAVGDFDENGTLDLAVPAYNGFSGAGAVMVLLGDGSGGFTAKDPILSGQVTDAVATGVFTASGHLDLIVANQFDSTVNFLMGNGNGTFQPAVPATTDSSYYPELVGVADFNADGMLDFAVGSRGAGSNSAVRVYQGHGDGTFTLKATNTFTVQNAEVRLAVGDFNADGHADYGAAVGQEIQVWLGDGNFGFTAGASATPGQDPLSITSADFNNDGIADLATGNSTSNNATIVLSQPTEAVSVTVNNVPQPIGTGTHNVQAHYVGDTHFNPVDSNTQPLTAVKATPTMHLTPQPPSPSTFGQTVTLTATFDQDSLHGQKVDGDTVDFYDGQTKLNTDPVKINGGQAQYPTSTLAAGSHSLKAHYNGGANLNAADSSPVSYTVNKATPTVKLNAQPPSPGKYGQTVTLTATFDQDSLHGQKVDGDTVDFYDGQTKLNPKPVTISGGQAQYPASGLAAGSHTFKAHYNGDANLNGNDSNTVPYMVGGAPGTLKLSVGPQPSVSVGTMATLTATITPATTGTVYFCETAAKLCTDINRIGEAQLDGKGTATFKFFPGIGSHSYTAQFAGSNTVASTTSNTAPLTVTGKYASATATGKVTGNGPYSIPVTVSGFAPPTAKLAPGGVVDIIDTTVTPNQTLGSATLSGAAVDGVSANPQNLPAGSSPYSIAAGDFNSDGIADIAVANSADKTVTTYIGTTDGKFAPSPKTWGTSGTPYPIAARDFDNNGTVDLAIGNSSNLTVFAGDGQGNFDHGGVNTAVSDFVGLVPGDFDNDGILDIAVIHTSSTQVYLGNGKNGFTAAATSAPYGSDNSHYAFGAAAGDVNKDGTLDLIMPDGNGGNIWVLLGAGDGTFKGSPNHYNTAGATVQTVTLADFDDNGTLDFAATVENYSTNTVVAFYSGKGDANGTFTQETSATIDLGASYLNASVVAGDFNADGLADVAVARHQSNTLAAEIFTGNGQWKFTSAAQFTPGSWAVSPIVADFNGDGFSDVAVANVGSANVSVGFVQPTVTINVTASNVAVPVGAGTHDVLARYEGDAHFNMRDSATLPLTGKAPPTVTLSLPKQVVVGNEVLLTATVTDGNTPVTQGTVYFCQYQAKLCTDINRLGEAQLTAPHGTATLTIRPGIGATGAYQYIAVFAGTTAEPAGVSTAQPLSVRGAYATITTLGKPTGNGPYSVPVTVSGIVPPTADLAPSKTVDILDTNNSGYLLGTATLPGTKAATDLIVAGTATLAAGAQPNSIATGDFNADGIDDLAVANHNDNTIFIYLAGSNGTFPPAPSSTISNVSGARPIAVGDFTNDGKLDLVAGANSNLSVFTGSGTGTFNTPPVNSPASDFAAFAVSDFNLDGKLDLAVVHSATLQVYLGNGAGSLTATGTPVPHGSDMANYATNAIAADFNQDGKPDLIMPDGNSGNVWVMLGQGTGTFESDYSQFALGETTTSVAVADFDTDGRLDFAASVENYSSAGFIAAFKGSGDGKTFTRQDTANYSIPAWQNSNLAVGDFNADGLADIAAAIYNSTTSSTVQPLIGAGSAWTFTPAKDAAIQPQNNAMSPVVGDFNGDGFSDVAVANPGSNSVSVGLLEPIATLSATASNISVVGTGTHAVQGHYEGDGVFAPSDSTATMPVPAEPVTVQMTMQPADGTPVEANQDLPLTVTLAPATAQDHSVDDLLVTITNKTTGEQIGQPQHPSKGAVNVTIQASQLQQNAKNQIEASTPGNDYFTAASVTNTYPVGMQNTPQPTGRGK